MLGGLGCFQATEYHGTEELLKRGMKPKCMSWAECVHVHKCVSVCGLGVGIRVTQGERVLGAQ